MSTRAADLLPPLQKLVRTLEDDLRERVGEVPELAAHVRRSTPRRKAPGGRGSPSRPSRRS
jgi:hypothetical protein